MCHRLAWLVCLCGLLFACGDDDGGVSGTSGTGGSGGESGTSGTGGSGGESGMSGTGGSGGDSGAAGMGGAGDDAGDNLDATVALDASLPDADVSDAADAGCTTPACQPCVTGQCGDHGTCMQTEQGPQCTCETGYTGNACGSCAQSYVVSSSTGLCVIPQQRQRTVHELRGTNCSAGGTATLSGLDLNDDGELSESEVTSLPTYQCFTPMVRTGDYYVSNLATLQALEGVTEITGTLFVDASTVSTLGALPTLTRLGGLTIRNNTLLTGLGGFLGLERVVGDVTIENNTALLNLAGFEQLRVIEGSLSIRNNAALTDLTGLERLTTVVGSLAVTSNASLATTPASARSRRLGMSSAWQTTPNSPPLKGYPRSAMWVGLSLPTCQSSPASRRSTAWP